MWATNSEEPERQEMDAAELLRHPLRAGGNGPKRSRGNASLHPVILTLWVIRLTHAVC
jgi:hypothetical protein